MNTNLLKKFAQGARRKLLEQVSARLDFVLNSDTAELRERQAAINRLRAEMNAHGRKQLVDKVAYTWFNRLMALRYMDVNDYEPLGIKVLAPLPGEVSPQLLQEAMAGNIPADLHVDTTKVMGLLDGRIKSAKPENDAYRLLLIAACNHLHKIFPFLFEQIDDHNELLLPDDLTSQFSIIHDVVEGMNEEDCAQVECIGWLYQFYISERKDEVFASKEKVKKEDIPAATQLFTPRWIVEYMVQNTVGKLWLMNHPESTLRQHMPYYIESEASKTSDYLKINSPEELTLLDQACGSGHILVYGFELLYRIYEEQGYNASEIPTLIIKHNLHGMEIDERAAQLSGLAILLKAREYQSRLFKKAEVPVPNILCYRDLPYADKDVKDALTAAGIKPSDELKHDLELMHQATNLGSLIIPHTNTQELNKVKTDIQQALPAAGLLTRPVLEDILAAINTLLALNTKYCCVVDNPPYMSGAMNNELSDYVRLQYPDSKTDLMACFMEAGLLGLKNKGMLGMINQHSWMFLSSYESLRKKLIEKYQFDTLLHLGPRTFPEIGGEVVQNAAFTLYKTSPGLRSYYIRLLDYPKSELKQARTIEIINTHQHEMYIILQENFKEMPGHPIGYWIGSQMRDIFKNSLKIGDISAPRQGLASSDNNRFLKIWNEVSYCRISFDSKSREDALRIRAKWFPYNKGGSFRKWYGNNEYVVNWENDGYELLDLARRLYGSPTRTIKNISHYFKPSITWSALSGDGISLRRNKAGFLFDTKGQCIFSEDDALLDALMAVLNSKVAYSFMQVLAPTLDFNSGVVAKVPFIAPGETVYSFIEDCVRIAENDWNNHETSWDFKQNELIRIKGQDLEETYDLYCEYWKNRFFQLHKNEEELNRQFIDIYGLQDELTPDVPLEDITILKEETTIENGALVFNAAEVMAQFVSYAVGCMFGRYSLDKEGLILASQGETLKDYYEKTGSDATSASFAPDADNIIPVLDDEWFDDDIVTSFHRFLKVTFGEKNFRKNIDFIEDQLGDLRKYFVKSFYADHIQRYKKRPIYWMFSSPKGHFNVLVYLHRYTPDTLNNILNNYLREFIEKLRTRMEHLKEVEVKGSATERTKATKEIEKLKLMEADCRDYERNILYPLATERIAIDLDNGVMVNYNCFGKAVKEVKGLNDSKAKGEVKKFDWIDTAMIR